MCVTKEFFEKTRFSQALKIGFKTAEEGKSFSLAFEKRKEKNVFSLLGPAVASEKYAARFCSGRAKAKHYAVGAPDMAEYTRSWFLEIHLSGQRITVVKDN